MGRARGVLRAPPCQRNVARREVRRALLRLEPGLELRADGLRLRAAGVRADARHRDRGEERQPEFVAEILEQVEHLRLHRDVERRYRLVGDDQPRAGDDRAGDADPLALPPGELVEVPVVVLGLKPTRAVTSRTRDRRSSLVPMPWMRSGSPMIRARHLTRRFDRSEDGGARAPAAPSVRLPRRGARGDAEAPRRGSPFSRYVTLSTPFMPSSLWESTVHLYG